MDRNADFLVTHLWPWSNTCVQSKNVWMKKWQKEGEKERMRQKSWEGKLRNIVNEKTEEN